MIESAARKTKQGSLVREGLMIESVTFRYNVERYGEDVEKLSTTAQFVAPVVVGRQRILRTRARFDCPWSVVGIADVDPEQRTRRWLRPDPVERRQRQPRRLNGGVGRGRSRRCRAVLALAGLSGRFAYIVPTQPQLPVPLNRCKLLILL